MMTTRARRRSRLAILLAGACASMLLVACAPSAGRATMTSGVWGYVASGRNAALEIDANRSSSVSLLATRVVAPVDGFLLATIGGGGSVPAMQVGRVAVRRGESRDVVIPIMGAKSAPITVTLFVDRGSRGRLEFNPMNPTSSPDRPVFVSGKPVATTVVIGSLGAPLGANAAVLDVFEQPAASTLNVTHIVSPGPSWVVVYAQTNGVPGRVIGRASIGATDVVGFSVKLAGDVTPRDVFVALQVDAGVVGTFEYDPANASATLPDAPYRAGGAELMKRVHLR